MKILHCNNVKTLLKNPMMIETGIMGKMVTNGHRRNQTELFESQTEFGAETK